MKSQISKIIGVYSIFLFFIYSLANASNLYCSNGGMIMKYNLDGTNGEFIGGINNNLSARSISVDSIHNKIYWTNDQGKLYIGNMDTSSKQIITGSSAYDIDLDLINNKIYCTNGGMIMRYDLDGTDGEFVGGINNNLGARSIAVDPIHDRLYWSDNNGKLWIGNSDTSSRQIITGSSVFDIDLDLIDNSLYCSNGGMIMKYDLSGSNGEWVGGINNNLNARSLAVDPLQDNLYWSDTNGKLWMGNLDTSSRRIITGNSVFDVTLSYPIPEPSTCLILGIGGFFLRNRK